MSDETLQEDAERYDERPARGRRSFDQMLAAPIRSLFGQRVPVTVPQDATVRDAVELMRTHQIGSMMVVDGDGALAGIFTERDIVARLVATDAGDPGFLRVDAIMHPVAAPLSADAAVCHAFNQVGAQQEFRHVPVVDGAGKPAGMVSARDLVALVVDAFPEQLANVGESPLPGAAEQFGG